MNSGLYLLYLNEVDTHIDIGMHNADTFMQHMYGPLDRFADILISLSTIYRVPLKSLHIFYDDSRGCIAFNRRETIYLNLRYFEVWREWFLVSIHMLRRR